MIQTVRFRGSARYNSLIPKLPHIVKLANTLVDLQKSGKTLTPKALQRFEKQLGKPMVQGMLDLMAGKEPRNLKSGEAGCLEAMLQAAKNRGQKAPPMPPAKEPRPDADTNNFGYRGDTWGPREHIPGPSGLW